MNKVFLVGRLTKDPEQRVTPNNVSVTSFTIAVNRRANREETDFLKIITWRGLADNCARYLVKGQQVAVTGSIQNRDYTDNDGKKHYITEIIADDVEFLQKPEQEPSVYEPGSYPQVPRSFAEEIEELNADLITDEELPF